MGDDSLVNGGPNWNANRNAFLQVLATALTAAFAAYVAIRVGLTEIRTNQTSMNERMSRDKIEMNDRMNRFEEKLDRVAERRR